MTRFAGRFLAIAGLAAAAAVTAVWLYTAFEPMRFMESGYPVWVAKQALLRDCRFGSILVLGDSRAEAAIVPADLPLPAANIGLGGTTPAETYVFARSALRCPKPPRMVVYAHSLSAYLYPNQGLWKSAVRYGYIGFWELRAMAAAAALDRDPSLASVSTHDGLTGIVRDVVYSAGFPSIFMASLIDARGFARYDSNEILRERTARTRGRVIYRPTGEERVAGMDADVAAFDPSPLETDYFDRTLALFDAAHIPVLLLAVPDSETTVRGIPAGTQATFARFIQSHAGQHQNVVAGTAGILAWPDMFYIDGSHMNEAGSQAFTERLAACLRQWKDGPTACDFGWR